MTNVIYDFATGWPIMPHIGVGIGAMNVFDGLKIPSRGLVFNDSSWQFGYQAIAGLRYDINPVLSIDLDYRYLATNESTFRILNTTLHYRTAANTNNFVASLTYRFGALLTDPPLDPRAGQRCPSASTETGARSAEASHPPRRCPSKARCWYKSSAAAANHR